MPGGGHIDLAEAKLIQTAGEVRSVKSQIMDIDDLSGHYLPVGKSA